MVQVTKLLGRIALGRFTGKGYPFLVQLNVTNRCNYRCTYCYGSYFERSPQEMSLEQITAIIDKLAAAGTFRLNLVGGEPLLRSDLPDIISRAHARGIMTAMTTNGSLILQHLNLLKGISTVCFSVDGKPENNDRHRGKGAFRRALQGLEACRAAGIPVQLSAVLNKDTVDDVNFMVSLAEHYRCLVGFTTLIAQEREERRTRPHLIPEKRKLHQALDRICALKDQKAPILFSKPAYSYARRWPYHNQDIIRGKQPEFKTIPCYAGKYFCLIDYNGDVYPCPQLIGLMQPKNILRDGLKAAMQRAANHGCQACSVPCSNDFNLFFGLNSIVWLDRFRAARRF